MVQSTVSAILFYKLGVFLGTRLGISRAEYKRRICETWEVATLMTEHESSRVSRTRTRYIDVLSFTSRGYTVSRHRYFLTPFPSPFPVSLGQGQSAGQRNNLQLTIGFQSVNAAHFSASSLALSKVRVFAIGVSSPLLSVTLLSSSSLLSLNLLASSSISLSRGVVRFLLYVSYRQ